MSLCNFRKQVAKIIKNFKHFIQAAQILCNTFTLVTLLSLFPQLSTTFAGNKSFIDFKRGNVLVTIETCLLLNLLLL